MFAVVSDIHSNIEALTTVLADIERRGITTIYCLGDVVGYGPNPRECLDLVIAGVQVCVLGNHDYAVLYEPTNFNIGAEQASYWCGKCLKPMLTSRPATCDGILWAPSRCGGHLPVTRRGEAQIDLVHASPRRPINEYIFPDDVYTNPGKVKRPV